MRRLLALLTVLVLLGSFNWMPASATSMAPAANVPAEQKSAASNVDLICTVNADGDCFVTMTVMLRMTEARQRLYFPLPAEAKNISMNGNSVSPTRSAASQDVDISRITRDYIGDAAIRFEYTIPEAVAINRDEVLEAAELNKKVERNLVLTLPMLSGFELPVEKLNFTITMPSAATFAPRFLSTYRQESAASDLKVISSGSQIIGTSDVILNDHEGLTMYMVVPEEMFPSVSTFIREGNPELVPMLICFGIAMLYWLLFLFNLPFRPSRTSTPPEGITAGEMGCHLTLAGADLTTMVFSWAQLGYILIHMDGNGRVLLNKRMDMGNERSAFENKIFKMLFGNRRTVDATGNQYAVLCGKVAELIPAEKTMYKGNSGNMKIFRYICCIAQVFCGICVAMNMTDVVVLQVVMSVILSIFGVVTAWMIQVIPYRNFLRGKTPVYVGLLCVLVWILLGIFCGQPWIPLGAALGQWLMGYFAAYGGRRSDLGRHDAGLILGFRRYVKRLPREDVGRLLSNDPDYFFNLAPFALALGVIRPFGNAFGRRKMDQCPYLMTPVQGKRTGIEWSKVIAKTADMMDARQRQMQWEKLVPIELPKISIQLNTQPQKKKTKKKKNQQW